MKCQKCGINEANTHWTKIVNGKKEEQFLCSECAELIGDIDFKLSFEDEFSNFLSGFFGSSKFIGQPKIKEDEICSVCNMTFNSFLKNGRVGCANCYETFSDKLIMPLKQIHGSSYHTGKIPERAEKELNETKKIKKLEKELKEAVEKQEFEKAAKLRDKIKEIKGEK